MIEYTHKALTAAGYERHVHRDYPGWVTYTPPGWSHWPRIGGARKVGFAGNDATMNNWIENVSQWKTTFPDTYAWWIDPAKKEPHLTNTNEVIIKGEDPMLKEAQDGHTDSATSV